MSTPLDLEPVASPRAPLRRLVSHDRVTVNEFTDGVLDPTAPMLGPLKDGGQIVATTAPGCWGPMITPAIRGGHEVTRPVAIAGAEVGDALAIHIDEITIASLATASGTDRAFPGRFNGDPYVAAHCPQCGDENPRTNIQGIGPEAIRCSKCGADATPFTIAHGYTLAFHDDRSVGVTLHRVAAEAIAREARRYAAVPANSIQNPILTFAPHDLVGVPVRIRPFLGQLGTVPGVRMPDSHNAGDFGTFLIGAPHAFALTPDELELRTDGHMDIDAVRAGAVVICPVKIPGGGVYLGDMHAMQGDGEIAGHTCDVAGAVRLRVHILKGLRLEGPILLPTLEDLPYLARPLSPEEFASAQSVAVGFGLTEIEHSAPISIVGTGSDLNAATDNGLRRAAALLNMPVDEVKNRATISGAIEIGRHPGVVQVTFLAPLTALERIGLRSLVCKQYNLT